MSQFDEIYAKAKDIKPTTITVYNPWSGTIHHTECHSLMYITLTHAKRGVEAHSCIQGAISLESQIALYQALNKVQTQVSNTLSEQFGIDTEELNKMIGGENDGT